MIQYHIDPIRRQITCRGTGCLRFYDLAAPVRELLDDTRNFIDFNALIILEDVDAYRSCSELSVLRLLFGALSSKIPNGRWAFVLPSESARVATETCLRAMNPEVAAFRCFSCESDAREWLSPAPLRRRVPATALPAFALAI